MKSYPQNQLARLSSPIKATLLLIAVSLFATGCNTTTYEHSFNPKTDLLTLRTFALLPIPHPTWDEGAALILGTDGLSLEFAKSILEEKGYEFVANGQADFLVGIRAEVQLPKKHGKRALPELAFG